MYARLFIVIECIIALIGSLSAVLLFAYFDPERGFATAAILMSCALFLALSSLMGILLYAIKKVLLRGEVSFWTAVHSWRQGVLVAIGSLSLIAFRIFGVLEWRTIGLLLMTLILMEGVFHAIWGHHD